MSDRLRLFEWMVLARAMDERLVALYRQGGVRGGSVFSGRGQEAYSAALAMQLRSSDLYAPLIRDSAGRLAFGEDPNDVFRTHLGRRTGPMRGRDGNMHRGFPARGQWPMISHLGVSLAVIAGGMLARRLSGRERPGDLDVGAVCIGDGGMNTGAAHEGLNIIAVERLPVVVAVADNQLSYSTFSDRTYACRSLVDRAAGYGLRGTALDGTDADQCLEACREAVARARRGEGPQLLVASLLRLAGHGEHDDASYVPPELKARFADCLPRQQERLIAEGLLDAGRAEAVWTTARERANAALAVAQGEPEADPVLDDWQAWSVRDLAGRQA